MRVRAWIFKYYNIIKDNIEDIRKIRKEKERKREDTQSSFYYLLIKLLAIYGADYSENASASL